MAIRANVNFKNLSGRPDSRALGPNQSLVIGSSTLSDLQLPPHDDVMDRHCCIRLTKDACVVEDLTKGSGILLAHGEAFSTLNLEGQTTIQVGQTEIEVLVTGLAVKPKPANPPSSLPVLAPEDSIVESPESEPVEELAAAEVETKEPDSEDEEIPEEVVQYEQYDSGLHCLNFLDDESGIEAFSNILKGRPFFESVNFLAIGEKPTDMGLENLVAKMMGEGAEDSLTFMGPAEFSAVPPALLESKSDDHQMLLFPPEKIELEDFKKSLQLHLSWLLRPSRFHFNMKNGLQNLVGAIFSNVQIALLYSKADAKWILLTLDETVVADFTGEP